MAHSTHFESLEEEIKYLELKHKFPKKDDNTIRELARFMTNSRRQKAS